MVFSTEVEDPVYGRYWRMVKAGLPDGAVKLAMKRDGVDPKGFKGFNSHAHADGAFYDALPPPPNLAAKAKKPVPPLPPRPPRKKDNTSEIKGKPKLPKPPGIQDKPTPPKSPKSKNKPDAPKSPGSKDKPKLPPRKTEKDKKKSPGRAARDRKVAKRNNDNEALREKLKKLESENAALKKKLSMKGNTAINADAKKTPSKLERKKSVNDLRKQFDVKADTPAKKRHSNKSKNSKNSVNGLRKKLEAKGDTPNGASRKKSVNGLKKMETKADKRRSKRSVVSRSPNPNPDRKKSTNDITRKSNNRSSNQKGAPNVVKGTPAQTKDWKKDIPKAKKAVNNIASKFEKGVTTDTPTKKVKAPKPGALKASKLPFQANNKDNKESKNKRLTGMKKKGGFGNMNKFRDKLEKETTAVASVRQNPGPQRRNSYGNGSFNPAPSFGGEYNGPPSFYRGNFDVPPSYGGGFNGPGSFGGGFGPPSYGEPPFGGGFTEIGEEWTECFSEEYQTPYYYNEITGESTWERPW